MRENDARYDIPSRIGWVFFILWMISHFVDILGRYEYEREFLILAIAFWAIGGLVSGARKKGGMNRKVKSGLRKCAGTLAGLWVLLLIFDALDLVGGPWGTQKHYVLIAGLVALSASFAVQAFERKKNMWQVRSSCYSIGGAVLVSWLVLAILNLYESQLDTLLVSGVVLIAIGYVLGVSRHAHDFLFSSEAIEGISEEMDEIPKRNAGNVRILKENITLERKATMSFDAGDAYVEVDGGNSFKALVFFGKGSYSLLTGMKRYEEEFMGICSLTGTDVISTTPSFMSKNASDSDCEELGLTCKEIRELAMIQVFGSEDAIESLEDLKMRVKRDGTKVDLKFIKVHEGSEGDYVKVGPIEIADMHDKNTRIKIWGREFAEKGTLESEMSPVGISYKILTTEGTTHLTTTNDKAMLRKEGICVEIKGEDTSIVEGKCEILFTGHKKKISCPLYELSLRMGKRAYLKGKGIKLSIREGVVSADYGENHVDETDETVSSHVMDEINNRSMDIAIESLTGETSAFDRLVLSLVDTLELT